MIVVITYGIIVVRFFGWRKWLTIQRGKGRSKEKPYLWVHRLFDLDSTYNCGNGQHLFGRIQILYLFIFSLCLRACRAKTGFGNSCPIKRPFTGIISAFHVWPFPLIHSFFNRYKFSMLKPWCFHERKRKKSSFAILLEIDLSM